MPVFKKKFQNFKKKISRPWWPNFPLSPLQLGHGHDTIRVIDNQQFKLFYVFQHLEVGSRQNDHRRIAQTFRRVIIEGRVDEHVVRGRVEQFLVF